MKIIRGYKPNSLLILLLIAAAIVILHALTNHNYGFHRDELATVDDAKHLAWGYVAYPPFTPFIARLALATFGPSLAGLRLFSSAAIALGMVFGGLIARELGGPPRIQVLTALAIAIAPIALLSGALFQYVSFDYLWWVLTAYLVVKLLKSEDPRWWVAIGTTIGFGMMTKYTMGLLVVGIVIGVLATPARRNLKSPWLWIGVAVSLLVFLPNLIWQWQHNFISLDFLQSIHERDVRIGRTSHNFIEQFLVCANIFTVPFWVAGLWYYLFSREGRRYCVLGWMYVVPLVLLLITQGRSYYLAPAYPMLIAGGVIAWQNHLANISARWARLQLTVVAASLAIGGLLFGAVMLPIAPVNSKLFNVTSKLHDNFIEEIGWPELVETIAGIYHRLPADEKSRAGVLAANYGEAGAINLFGPQHRLPVAISGVNSYWLRGYSNSPPQTLIVVGFSRARADAMFESCELAARVSNRYGIANEESRDHPEIFLCRNLRQPWSEFWQRFRYYG